MPGTLVLDEIRGAIADIGATSGSIVRSGTLEGIDASNEPDAGVILAVLSHPDMPLLGKDIYPGTNMVFLRMLIQGFNTNGVFFLMRYESFQGIIPSAYIITDDSTMSSRTLTFDPFTKKLLEVSYTEGVPIDESGRPVSLGQSGAMEVGKLDRILCPTEVLMPCREINITRVTVGHPDLKGRNLFGGVNDNDWPGSPGSPALQSGSGAIGQILWTTPAPVGDPLPPGYWLINRMKSTWTRFQNYFQTDISAISLVNMPWSQLLVARDPSTGLFVKPDAGRLKAALEDAFKNYTPGLIQFNKDGFAIFGPYPKVDYKIPFGF